MNAVASPHRWRMTRPEREAFQLGDERSTVEWAEAEIRLPPSIAELHGPWRSAVTPYARGPMNLWDDEHVRRSVKCWAPQTAKTLTSVLPVLRKLARGLGPALLVMNTEGQLRKLFQDYVIPIAQASPGLIPLLGQSQRDLTASSIRLVGERGRLDGAWATSLPRLKSFSYRITLGDEVQDWPADVEGGGDPESLLDVRMRFYPHTSRMELISSPGGERGIWQKYLGCELCWVLLARCPECGAEQRMTWPEKDSPHFPRWAFNPSADPDRIESSRLAAYVCAGCGSHWHDADRDRAVREGRWAAVEKAALGPEHWHDPFPVLVADASSHPVSVGSHLPAWCSPMVPLSKVVAEFLRAHRSPDPVDRIKKLKTWTNNYPALPWVDEPGAAIAEVTLLDLRDADRPEGLVPGWALGLLLGADVQADGVWYEIRAWGEHGTSAGVAYGFLPKGVLPPELVPGAAALLADDLRALLALSDGTWSDPDGRVHAVRLGLVDSGYRTDEVYELCRVARRLVPAKGTESEARRHTPLTYSDLETYPGTRRKIEGGLKLVSYAADVWKDALARRLEIPQGAAGCWGLHSGTGHDYAQHFLAESRDDVSGRWSQRGRQPNHLWDCAVLQLVCYEMLGRAPYQVWTRLAAERKTEEERRGRNELPSRPAGPPSGRTRLW